MYTHVIRKACAVKWVRPAVRVSASAGRRRACPNLVELQVGKSDFNLLKNERFLELETQPSWH